MTTTTSYRAPFHILESWAWKSYLGQRWPVGPISKILNLEPLWPVMRDLEAEGFTEPAFAMSFSIWPDSPRWHLALSGLNCLVLATLPL